MEDLQDLICELYSMSEVDTIASVAGALVGLVEFHGKEEGHPHQKDIIIDGGPRKITIHGDN